MAVALSVMVCIPQGRFILFATIGRLVSLICFYEERTSELLLTYVLNGHYGRFSLRRLLLCV